MRCELFYMPSTEIVGIDPNHCCFVTKRSGRRLLRELEADIDAVKLDGHDVPVKLKVFDSLFVPLAKWSMLLTGNYRSPPDSRPSMVC